MVSTLNLWPAQQEAVEFACSRSATALFFEQRTGKTFITMGILSRMADASFTGVLMCILNNRDSTWMDKLTEYLPQLNVTTNWDEFKKLPCPRLFLVHYEAFPKLIKKIAKFKAINWMTIDEAHKISRRGTKQSRAAARMSWVSWRMILTGTPIEKKPTDMFGQFRFLDPELFGTNWAEFENEYLDFATVDMTHAPPGSALWQRKMLQQRILRGKAKFNPEKLIQFTELIKPYSMRVTKIDVGILEPIIKKVVVPMLGAQRRYYEAMEKHSVVRLDTGQRVISPLAVTNIMKCRQLASGFVYDDDGDCHYVGDAKLRRLKTLVEQSKLPIVIFTAFKPDNERIGKALRGMGYDVAIVTGSTKKKLRPEIWRQHQRGQHDITLVQIKTGGVGVDLWKANTAIVHSMGHSYIDFDQAKSRLDNRDKIKPSTIWVICAENTIDEDIHELVIVKRLTSEEVLSQLKQRRKQHVGQRNRSKVYSR